MRFIKYFKLFLEKFTDNCKIDDWVVEYYNTKSHNINDKIIERTDIKNESEFYEILRNIIIKCNSENIKGEYIFVSFKYSIKIVSKIINKKLRIITILGKNEKIKENNKTILI